MSETKENNLDTDKDTTHPLEKQLGSRSILKKVKEELSHKFRKLETK
jgi:hypothetical protein